MTANRVIYEVRLYSSIGFGMIAVVVVLFVDRSRFSTRGSRGKETRFMGLGSWAGSLKQKWPTRLEA